MFPREVTLRALAAKQNAALTHIEPCAAGRCITLTTADGRRFTVHALEESSRWVVLVDGQLFTSKGLISVLPSQARAMGATRATCAQAITWFLTRTAAPETDPC